MSIPRHTRRRGLVFSFVLCGLLLVGCASPDPVYLPALKADPMASYSHPDLDLVSSGHSPKHRSWLGSEHGANVWRSWMLEDGADVDAITRDLVDAAEQAGWAFRTLDPEPVYGADPYWRAQKYLDEGLAELVFRWDLASWRGGIELRVHLHFTQEDVATPALSATRDSTYESLADLRAAIEASGLRCNEYSSWNPDVTRYEWKTAVRCNEFVSLHVFDTQDETLAHLQRSLEFEAAHDQAHVVGPNWIVTFSDNGELGDYLQGELGGDLTGDDDE